MQCWNMTGGSVEQCCRSRLDLIEEQKEQRTTCCFARRTSRSHRNRHRALNLVHVKIAGRVAVGDPGLLHRAQFCGLLAVQRAHQIFEILVEEIVPDYPFDTIAIRRAGIGGSFPRIGASVATRLNTHCRSPSSTSSWYLIAQFRIAATSCTVGLRVCAAAGCANSPGKMTASPSKARALIPLHRVFSKISRPISMRRISLVPAPIS